MALNTQVFVLFIIAVAAAEVAVGLALAMVVYRNRHTVSIDKIQPSEMVSHPEMMTSHVG